VIASPLLGLGGALLWVSQGTYLTVVSGGEARGYLSGIFFGIFSLNLPIGTLISSFLLQKSNPSVMLWILSVVGFLGVLMLCFTRPTDSISMKDVPLSNPKDSLTFFFQQKKMICLQPLVLFQGICQSFTFGSFPLLLSLENISYVFMAYGISSNCSYFITGRLYDRFGWKILVICSFIIGLIAYFSCLIGALSSFLPLMFIYAALIGWVECSNNNLISATIMELYPQNPTPALAGWRCSASLAAAVGFGLSRYLSFVVIEIIAIVFLTASTISFFVLYMVVVKNEKLNESSNPIKNSID